MSREDIRRENARALARKVNGQIEFGRVLKMEPSQVSQIIGKTPIKNIGNSIARRIEQGFSKPEGWLDVPHQSAAPGDTLPVATSTPPAPLAPTPPPTSAVHTQWVRDDEARLLDLYRTTDEAGRERIMTVAEGEPRSALRGISIVGNQS